ncbi:hypothetical protein MBANPS3_005966 [Mucor bainieri]
MDAYNLVEISNVIYEHTKHQIQKRKYRITQFLSNEINEDEPVQQILKQSDLEHQQMYYQHLMEIEKRYDRYIDSLNHIAEIIPSNMESANVIAVYDRIISSWQLLLNINYECRLDLSKLPDVEEEEHRMEGAWQSSQQAFASQLKVYIWLLIVVVGSAYFIVRGVLFVGGMTKILTEETQAFKLWLQLKQDIDNIHCDLIVFTDLVHDTVEYVKSMWVEKKLQALENM